MSGPNATVWTTDEGEYIQGAAQTLVDSSSVSLVDSNGEALIDGGVTVTPIQATAWATNDTL